MRLLMSDMDTTAKQMPTKAQKHLEHHLSLIHI